MADSSRPKQLQPSSAKKRKPSEAKRAADKSRSKTRVNLGWAFPRWRQLKELKGMRSDAELSCFLLDRCAALSQKDAGVNEQSTDLGPHDVCVNINSLLQLFRQCGQCSSDCVLKRQGNCWCFSVIQHCQICNQLSTWNSQPCDNRKTSGRNEIGNKELQNVQERILFDSETDAASCREECHLSSEVKVKNEGIVESTMEETVVAEMEVTIDSTEEDQEEMGTFEEEKDDDEEEEEEEEEEEKEERCSSDSDFDPGSETDETESIGKGRETERQNPLGEADVDIAVDEGDALSSQRTQDQEQEQFPELCPDCGVFYIIKKHQHKCDHKTKLFPCLDCGKRYLTEPSLKAHRRTHQGIHPCRYCLKPFRTQSNKQNHEMNHSYKEKQSFQCSECPQTFYNARTRNHHLRKHVSRRPICHTCYKEFPTRHLLERHEVSHSVNKPHRCQVCQRTFAQASQLKSHLRVHTGERPFQCKLCLKSFNHNISLKNHIRRYHPGESCHSSDPGLDMGGRC